MIEALGIAMVKNEADVIEAFVRHNLQFMDALFIGENDSVDGTREILVQLRQEGLPIVLFDDPIVGHFQAEKVTELYRRIMPEFKSRFVFLLDADEFIIAPSKEALYLQLRGMQPGCQAQYYWRTYIPAPTSQEGGTTDPLRRITHRRANEEPWAKSIIVTDPTFDTKLKVEQGNHSVTYAGKPLPTVKLQDIVLAHFPVRSIDQATGKALVGWITNLERHRRRPTPGMGFQKKLLYQRIVHGPGLTPEDLTREALKYAQYPDSEYTKLRWPEGVVCEPVVPGYDALTLQPAATCTPLQKLARCVDKILNPEADSAEAVGETEFLQILDQKPKKWYDYVPQLPLGGKLQAQFSHLRIAEDDFVDLPPFRYLADRDRPASVLDIGCGSGAYLKYFATRGTEAIRGVDSIDGKFGYLQPNEYTRVDLERPLDLSDTFDLVICTSVIDNTSPHLERVLVDNIAGHASKHIVFCGERHGESRAAHVNSQTIAHWLDLFQSAGWYPCLFDTLALRSLSTLSWFRTGLVVFIQDDRDAVEARARLMELDKHKARWNMQRPGVITHPFTETASKLPKERGPVLTTTRNTVKALRSLTIFDPATGELLSSHDVVQMFKTNMWPTA